MDTKKVYNYLNGLNTSLIYSSEAGVIRDNSWEKYNSILKELEAFYSDSLFKEYQVSIRPINGTPTVNRGEFQRKVFGATQYLHEQYLDEWTLPPKTNDAPNGNTTPQAVVHQTQSNQQSTEVNVEFNITLMQMSEVLAKAEENYPDTNSLENKFIKKIKELLPTAKSSIEIISLVLKCAKDFGIDPAVVLGMTT